MFHCTSPCAPEREHPVHGEHASKLESPLAALLVDESIRLRQRLLQALVVGVLDGLALACAIQPCAEQDLAPGALDREKRWLCKLHRLARDQELRRLDLNKGLRRLALDGDLSQQRAV